MFIRKKLGFLFLSFLISLGIFFISSRSCYTEGFLLFPCNLAPCPSTFSVRDNLGVSFSRSSHSRNIFSGIPLPHNVIKSNVNKRKWGKSRLYSLDDKKQTLIPTTTEDEKVSEKKELTLTEKVKNAGISGVFAYALTELGFWIISLPSAILYYHYQTNEWLNFNTSEDQVKVAAFSAAFVSFARLVVPLRLGLALALTPFINKTIVEPLQERGFLLPKTETE